MAGVVGTVDGPRSVWILFVGWHWTGSRGIWTQVRLVQLLQGPVGPPDRGSACGCVHSVGGVGFHEALLPGSLALLAILSPGFVPASVGSGTEPLSSPKLGMLQKPRDTVHNDSFLKEAWIREEVRCAQKRLCPSLAPTSSYASTTWL